MILYCTIPSCDFFLFIVCMLKAGSSQTVLSAKYVTFQNLPGCEEIPAVVIENIKKKTEVDTPLCRVKSGVDGLFVFPSVPSGEYTLVMNNWTYICHKIVPF